MQKITIIATLILIIDNQTWAQDNAGTSLAPGLIECYNNSLILTRDLRLPSTINVLIDLIRKAEDGNPQVNARELSLQLLHRFRQDGMYRNENLNETTYALPYTPRRFEAYKNRVQLKKLTPGSAVTFNNNSLSLLERCSLHSMISSTIERQERGDESTVCTHLSRYTSRLSKRATNELSIEKLGSTTPSHGSTCPIESGVVYTKWGTVKAGLLLSGIAAGFQPLSIPTSSGLYADNRYGSTLAGELTEAALYQAIDQIKIGTSNNGGWNSTLTPKYYFIQSQDNLQVTDAEIRGGLDGLFLALKINDWKTKFSNIKVSQILDMYYSSRGVFNNSIRACNRKVLETDLMATSSVNLVNETMRFSYLLDEEATSLYSVQQSAYPQLAQNSFNSFTSYFPSLNDLDCSAEETTIQRSKTDLIIVLDTTWNFKTIQPIISYILENIDINKYESRYAFYTGGNVNEIINTTNTILDFHENYTLLEHQKYATGFDYNRVYDLIENLVIKKLDNSSDITGQSLVVLLIPYNSPSDGDRTNIRTKRDNLKVFLPDVRTIVLGTGSQDSYSDLVWNSSSDIFITSDTTDQTTQKSIAKSVATRVKNIHRSVINPHCGSRFQSSSSTSSFDLVNFVEPQAVNYHRISANYFINRNSEDNKSYLKVRGAGYGTVIVCMSRSDTYPRSNSTGNNCTTLTSNDVSFDVTDYCGDSIISECQPIYLSVEGVTTSTVRCSDNLCRFPDSIKYTIALENVGCASGSQRILSVFSFISFLSVILFCISS